MYRWKNTPITTDFAEIKTHPYSVRIYPSDLSVPPGNGTWSIWSYHQRTVFFYRVCSSWICWRYVSLKFIFLAIDLIVVKFKCQLPLPALHCKQFYRFRFLLLMCSLSVVCFSSFSPHANKEEKKPMSPASSYCRLIRETHSKLIATELCTK